MTTAAPITDLRELLEAEGERVVRLWAKRLRAETYEVDLPGRDLREPLGRLLSELVRLLRDRGDDTLRLWPEVVRSHGAHRYEQRFEPEDLAREFKALEEVLLHVAARHYGELEPGLVNLVVELVCEAHAAAQAAFCRVLRTEEVRFREAAVMETVLHHVDVGILLAEPEGGITFVTPPVSRLLGVPVRGVVGTRDASLLGPILSQLNARHPDGRPFRVQEMPFLVAVRERQPVRGVKMHVDRPGAGEAILELTATPIWEEGGEREVVGVLQTFSDRTESAAKTRALMMAHDELRRLQGRLLQRTRTQALGQLASGAAHALNNFLNVLRLRITLLRREPKPEHLDALDRTVGQIGELVGRLQEFSVQRTEEQVADVGVDTTVREALELASADLEQEGRRVDVSLVLGEPGCVRGDPGFFRELVVNLLFAARDRMPQGGRLEVKSWTDRDGWAHLRLQDEGPPYSPQELTQLFDPLNRTANTPHLSLLLAVARNQVQRWGGELTVENGASGGAVFQVRLPAVAAASAAMPAEAPAARPAPELAPAAEPAPASPVVAAVGARRFQQTRRVLVVDDDVDNARMMAEVLEEEGYAVQVATSPQVALCLWDQHRFDAALLDALMPEMSGWELARELRERTPQVLLAIVTGMDVRGQSRATLALVDAVFRKPVDMGALDEFLSQREREGEAAPEAAPAPN